jgi:hypothetical protein
MSDTTKTTKKDGGAGAEDIGVCSDPAETAKTKESTSAAEDAK